MAAGKQHEFKLGDVVFYAKGHVVAQRACPRGEPPRETTLWCINGEPERGWMGIETFGRTLTRNEK